jgi:hypothetical protein
VKIPGGKIATVQYFKVDLYRDLFGTEVKLLKKMGNCEKFFRLVLLSIHDNFHKQILAENFR